MDNEMFVSLLSYSEYILTMTLAIGSGLLFFITYCARWPQLIKGLSVAAAVWYVYKMVQLLNSEVHFLLDTQCTAKDFAYISGNTNVTDRTNPCGAGPLEYLNKFPSSNSWKVLFYVVCVLWYMNVSGYMLDGMYTHVHYSDVQWPPRHLNAFAARLLVSSVRWLT